MLSSCSYRPERLGPTAQDGSFRLLRRIYSTTKHAPLIRSRRPAILRYFSLVGACVGGRSHASNARIRSGHNEAALAGAAVVNLALLRSGSAILAALAVLMTVASSCLVAWAGTILFPPRPQVAAGMAGKRLRDIHRIVLSGDDDAPFEGAEFLRSTKPFRPQPGEPTAYQPLAYLATLGSTLLAGTSIARPGIQITTQPRTIEWRFDRQRH